MARTQIAPLKVEPIAWSSEVAAALDRLPRGVADKPNEWFRGQMDTGAIVGLGVFEGDYQVATVLIRGDDDEFVIVAAAGGRRGIDLTRQVLPEIERRALCSGFECMRIHTARQGLMRKLARQGYVVSEVVFRKRLVLHA